jgi:hypothetical protein
MHWSALLAWALSVAAGPSVFGYVDHDRFHPLLIVESSQLGPYDARTTSLVGVVRNAFEAGGAEFPIQRDVEYTAPDGEPARYGLVPGRSEDGAFFELNRGAKPREAAVPSDELVRSFLRWFADDERSGDVRVLFATDLDHDGKKELWLSFRLASGRLGRMVFEQRAAAGEWVELASHCYLCN